LNTPAVSAAPPSGLRAFAAAWNRFWFEPVHTHALGLLRLFFGLVMTLRALKVYGLYRIGDMRPALPRYEYDLEEIYGAFTMPWPKFDWLPAPTLWWYERIDEVGLLLLVLFTVGLFTRVVAPLLAGIFAYVFLATQLNYYHHVWCYTLVFAILAFSPCGERYSLDSYLRGKSMPRPRRSVLPLRLIQVLMTLLYGFTFVSKLNPGYLSGRIMFLFHEAGSIEGPFYGPVLELLGYKGLAWFTLAAEGLVPLAIWFPRLRLPAIWVGCMLHLGIDMMMSQRTFSYQMMTLYIVFTLPMAGAHLVLFDGRCEPCRRGRRIAGLLDWLRRTTWLDVRDPALVGRIPARERESLEEGLTVIRPDGGRLTGFDAWRHLLARFPLTFLLGAPLWLPGTSQLLRFAYERLATHGRRGGHVLPAAAPTTESEEEAPWTPALVNWRERLEPSEVRAGGTP
jgi:hypothetical protein